MPNKKSKKIQAVVSDENYQILEDIAGKQGLKLADFVRETLQKRCKELGYEIDLNLDSWGGKRSGAGKKPLVNIPG